MPRGNFWEATYDPDWDGPTAKASLSELDGTTGLARCLVIEPNDAPVIVRWKIRDRTPRRFQECDFQVELHDSFVSDCTFDRCRFKGSAWTRVKFSNCAFENCDFSGIAITECHFLSDCRFCSNSASAQLFQIEDTAISAGAFIPGLATNVKHLPEGVSAGYQEYRFVGTRQKLAIALFAATRNEANLEYYDEAYEQLVRCTLDERVEQYRFDPVSQRQASTLSFIWRSIPARIERGLVCTSGWLTCWGRSLVRPSLFLCIVIGLFATVYGILGHADLSAGLPGTLFDPLLEATNITLVAGYTSYFDSSASGVERAAWMLNLILGLYWYSLIIPVLARRVLR